MLSGRYAHTAWVPWLWLALSEGRDGGWIFVSGKWSKKCGNTLYENMVAVTQE